jgi:hypothetical protein
MAPDDKELDLVTIQSDCSRNDDVLKISSLQFYEETFQHVLKVWIGPQLHVLTAQLKTLTLQDI